MTNLDAKSRLSYMCHIRRSSTSAWSTSSRRSSSTMVNPKPQNLDPKPKTIVVRSPSTLTNEVWSNPHILNPHAVSERRGDNFKRFKDFKFEAKSRFSYMCHIRRSNTSAGRIASQVSLSTLVTPLPPTTALSPVRSENKLTLNFQFSTLSHKPSTLIHENKRTLNLKPYTLNPTS